MIWLVDAHATSAWQRPEGAVAGANFWARAGKSWQEQARGSAATSPCRLRCSCRYLANPMWPIQLSTPGLQNTTSLLSTSMAAPIYRQHWMILSVLRHTSAQVSKSKTGTSATRGGRICTTPCRGKSASLASRRILHVRRWISSACLIEDRIRPIVCVGRAMSA